MPHMHREAGPEGLPHSPLFWDTFQEKISGPAYSSLQSLCLTEVGLRNGSARAFDFGVLRTLKLRNCERWEGFLGDAVRLGLLIGLKTLEVQAWFNETNYSPQSWGPASEPGSDGDPGAKWNADKVVSDFLVAFNGLKELYVSLEGPLVFDKLLPGVVAHRASLQRFVHDLTTVDGPNLEYPLNVASLTDNGYTFAQSVSKVPFQFEAEGLLIRSARLTNLIQSSAQSTSLKLLHLRQLELPGNPDQSLFFQRLVNPKSRTMCAGRIGNFRLRPELQTLAKWAFGKDGLPSLKAIACGDYVYGGRPPVSDSSKPTDVILCRPEPGSGKGFRILDKHNKKVKDEREEIIDAYRDLLEACPKEFLMDWYI